MIRYLARRVALLVPTLFLLGTVLFFLLRVMPGNIAMMLTGGQYGSLSPKDTARLEQQLGLNEPMYQQYFKWLKQTLSGNLGYSLLQNEPVDRILFSHLQVTIALAVVGTICAIVFSLPMGIAAALWRGSVVDQAVGVITGIGLAMPAFWVGILILVILSDAFGWSPPVVNASLIHQPALFFVRIVFPGAVVGFRAGSALARVVRSTMLEVINSDYIRTARAKGVAPWFVTVRHALPNTLLPVITMATLLLAGLLEGVVILEQVYALPGIGREFINAINYRDFPLVEGFAFAIGLAMMVIILLTDMTYALIDPRVKYE